MTMNTKKQMKITKFSSRAKVQEDCVELKEEIEQLEQKLKEKQNELFQIQRSSYRCKKSPIKDKMETFSHPMKIVANSLVDGFKNDIAFLAMLSGMEVQSYKENDHCSVVYHMQHESKHEVKHGLQIDLSSDSKQITKCSMPLGFNLTAVIEEFDNIMEPKCLSSIRKALVAYYDRLEQFEALKNIVQIEASLFKIIDGSHMEISFLARNERDPDDDEISIILMLDYRVYDIRPKNYSFIEIDLPENAAEILRQQCLVFKKKPLHKAFREAFISGIGPYRLVQQVGCRPIEQEHRRPKRSKPNKQHYNNDDTFHPDDCSDSHDDDEAH